MSVTLVQCRKAVQALGNKLPEKKEKKRKYYAVRRYIKRSFEVNPGFPW